MMKTRRPKRSDIPTLEVLRLVRDNQLPEDVLQERFPFKVIIAKMRQLVRQGLLDYGINVRYSFLTPEGERLLREMNA